MVLLLALYGFVVCLIFRVGTAIGTEVFGQLMNGRKVDFYVL